jgi:Uma2 family endonuclease
MMPSVTATWAEMFQVSVPTVETELIGESDRVVVPAGITSLDSFRDWALSEQFPQNVRIDYLSGVIWVDLSMEELYSHNQTKFSIYITLGRIVQDSGLGMFIPDRMRFTYPGADASVEPDGAYVSYRSLREGDVRQIPGREGGVMILEGSPDMVLEVLSESSVEKDTERLPDYYAAADVEEFWRVDARAELMFEILRLTPDGYVPAPEPDGWWRSAVFGRSFRLVRGADPLGRPAYTLETRL